MKTKPTFKAGDIVDVTDLRDGTVVNRGAKILSLSEQDMTNLRTGKTERKLYASLDAGYACSVRCLSISA